jgi:hypothetical protein
MSANDVERSAAETPPGAPPTRSAGAPSAAPPAAPPAAPAAGALAGWRDDLITLVAIVVMAGAGAGLFYRTEVYLTLGLVAGLTSGIGCTRWWRAALVAAIGVFGGFALASLIAEPRWHDGFFWMPLALPAAAVAALVGAAACFALAQSTRLRPLLTAIAVLGLIATMWFSGLALATIRSAQGYVPIEKMATFPQLKSGSNDEDIYLNYLARMRAGEPYYKVAAAVFEEIHALNPASPPLAGSATSYRLPTLYVLLAKMPNPGMMINLLLLVCSFGVGAAYVLARRFVTPVPALLGASLVASMLSGYTGPMLLDPESWAGVLALCSAMFVVLAGRDRARTMTLHIAAATCALLATSLRELSVAFILVGLSAALAGPSQRAMRVWIPWAAALAGAVAIYAAHIVTVRNVVRGLASPPVSAARWLHLDGSGLLGAVRLASNHMWVVAGFGAIFVILGMIGSVLAPKDLPTRLMLGGIALAGPLVLLAVRPPGTATYGAPGYWGDLVIPTTLACVPLAFALLPGVKREDADGLPPVT